MCCSCVPLLTGTAGGDGGRRAHVRVGPPDQCSRALAVRLARAPQQPARPGLLLRRRRRRLVLGAAAARRSRWRVQARRGLGLGLVAQRLRPGAQDGRHLPLAPQLPARAHLHDRTPLLTHLSVACPCARGLLLCSLHAPNTPRRAQRLFTQTCSIHDIVDCRRHI